MRKALLLLAVAALLLAGCAGSATESPATKFKSSTTEDLRPDRPTASAPGSPSASASPAASSSSSTPTKAPTSTPSATPGRMTIRGVVVTEALYPLRATVKILETGQDQLTDSGTFRFDDLRPDVYFLTASADGFVTKTLSVTPEAARQEVRFVLEADRTGAPYNQTLHFRGAFECALEVLIISPSCDTLITSDKGLNRPDLAQFNTTNTFTTDVQAGWKTIVVDVVFDPSGQPLLDGMRVTVQGSRNQTGLGTYEQYGRFNGQSSFTFRLEPGETYEDNTAGPMPADTAGLRFEVFPQSNAWHLICSPDGVTCFLGVGAGLDVQFELFVTVFYNAPAPYGFTLQAE